MRDLRIAYGLGMSLRRFRGWEPETRLVKDEDDWVVVREPEFDKEQYELFVALHEHEASIDDYGFPLEESTSIDADPMNPDGRYEFVASPVRLWSEQAVVDAQNDPKWSGENHTPARKWRVKKVMR